MTMTVSDIAKVPTEGYDWYVFILDDKWDDPFREELRGNIETLGNEVGRDNLVVQGFDRMDFDSQVFHRYRLYLQEHQFDFFPLPSIVVSNIPPPEIEVDNEEIKNSVLLIFHLSDQYIRPGSISDFLGELSRTLRNPKAEQVFMKPDKTSFQALWGWIDKYFEIKPEFLGIGVDVNQMLNDLFSK